MMIHYRILPLLLLAVSIPVAWSAPHTVALHGSNDQQQDYSFDQYVQEFGKSYATEKERQERESVFWFNYQHILAHNARESNHFLAVNEFTDRKIPHELPLGYDKSRHAAWNQGKYFVSTMATSTTTTSSSSRQSLAEEHFQEWLETKVMPVSQLPDTVDWRKQGVVTDVKQQGMCGSCWAVASTALLESHIALMTGQLFNLSTQEIVSCVTNPQHCGGSGGCGGATYELAMEFAMAHGMVPEKDFPYQSGFGRTPKCHWQVNGTQPEEPTSSHVPFLRDSVHKQHQPLKDSSFLPDAVATIQGYVHLPTNNYTVLMNAVASLGPIGVTAAASRWAFYKKGVFDLPHRNATDATDMNHAVVLEGYGVDETTKQPYWLVRNSWGKRWGEDGYIRLKRVDPNTVPDPIQDDCGIDVTPADGAACTKDKDGHDIVPKPVRVCGTAGILFDSFVPIGGRLLPTPSSVEHDAAAAVY